MASPSGSSRGSFATSGAGRGERLQKSKHFDLKIDGQQGYTVPGPGFYKYEESAAHLQRTF